LSALKTRRRLEWTQVYQRERLSLDHEQISANQTKWSNRQYPILLKLALIRRGILKQKLAETHAVVAGSGRNFDGE
jgi:hypothetical protein